MPFSPEDRIQNSFSVYCGLQISRIQIQLPTVWGRRQEKVYKTGVTDLDIKHRIRSEWAKLDHAVIAAGAVVASATVISSTVFDFNIVFVVIITATFLAVVDQSNSCMVQLQ